MTAYRIPNLLLEAVPALQERSLQLIILQLPDKLFTPLAAIYESSNTGTASVSAHFPQRLRRMHMTIFFESIADVVTENQLGIYRVHKDTLLRFDPPKFEPKGPCPKGVRWYTAAEDAADWINSRREGAYTFGLCCDLLNWNAGKMRKMIFGLPHAPKVNGHASAAAEALSASLESGDVGKITAGVAGIRTADGAQAISGQKKSLSRSLSFRGGFHRIGGGDHHYAS